MSDAFVSVPKTRDVRDQYSSYVDPRGDGQTNYEMNSRGFDLWLERVREENYAEGFAAGKRAVREAQQPDETLPNSFD